MSWIPLSDRLSQLPLIMAGPILRRTETDAVTVWIALRTTCDVTLRVCTTKQGMGSQIEQIILKGKRATVRLGEHLHIVAVTAKPLNNNSLKSGQIYAYDLEFNDHINPQQTLQQALNSPFCTPIEISYFDHGLPTFALAPKDLNKLRLAHGSCRKPQGKGLDALPILDDFIEQNAANPNTRLHQLFFTGDQIYGDDVADPLLLAATEAGDTLLGWEEHLPLTPASTATLPYFKAKQLKPGQRSHIAEIQGGFTAGLRNQPERAKSHLFSLGEYCATYLFFWSSRLWPNQFPSGREVYKKAKQIRHWNKEVKALKAFVYTLDKVQRLLANVPTYMIFDDHDISDDWYLNQAWCLRVLGKPLGRRTVQNGMLAYALFQAWGNTPEQFEEGQSGDKLLKAATDWSTSQGVDQVASEAIARYLGLPPQDPATGLPQLTLDGDVLILKRDALSLRWHYTLRSDRHEVIVLDTRTWRGYPLGQEPPATPMLLSPTAFEQQIRQPLQQTDQLMTLVVAPTNLISLQIIDWIQQWNLNQRQIFSTDVGDAWNIHKGALATLLNTLFEQRNQVIVLSGDIHYSSAVRLDYWQESQPSSNVQILAQLTSSAFSNSEFKTRLVHTKLKSLLPESSRKWVGWKEPFDLVEMKTRQSLNENQHSSPPDWSYRIEWIKRQPAQIVPWGKNALWLTSYYQPQTSWFYRLINWITLLWRNRWLQEGHEVVGLNNLGIISFTESELILKAVTQDLYWYPPWQPSSIVFSRYDVSTLMSFESSSKGATPHLSQNQEEKPDPKSV